MPRCNVAEYPGRQEPSMTAEEVSSTAHAESVQLLERSSFSDSHASIAGPSPGETGGNDPPSTTSDQALARALHQELNNPLGFVVAQPVFDTPFNCGSCGTTHQVRGATPGSQFQCSVCGSLNLLPPAPTPLVMVERTPYPLVCNLQ
ncbi:hypothetical protein H310_07550 [Aphanomyces invadans]|uniref:Uncharacterized protein n=1 Tax=Aphanomyces invadans TaxID=157072 RepID=A0A024U2K8_9STRA|nr:hypothetical protein H310_07550 [Aphanomyces invadans]ETW00142.1 hypothetical protein H310_07550 [Aphanomyces invadans]|eukprot:XP_008871167.1 hypothetical protein H310_07550 [Aphanomyces invadans]